MSKENNSKENINTASCQTDVRRSICDGDCKEHKGDVIRVKIYGNGWGGLTFNYCQEAIEEDERRGFVIEYFA